MSFNVGMNIVEVDGKATPSIQPAATSITGFIIKSQRGLAGVARRVTNWSQFREHFGDYISDGFGAYSVRGFLDNGGQTAIITRVVNSSAAGATPATLSSNDGPWNLDDADVLTVRIGVEGVFTDVAVTFVDGPAVVTGGAGPFDLGTNNAIGFTINGVVSDEYIFQNSDSGGDLSNITVAEVAVVINREFSGIRAFDDAGSLTVRTDRGDSDATIAVSGSSNAEIGFGGPSVGTGNVQDVNNIDVTEMVSILNADLDAAGMTVTATGNAIVITHDTAGSNNTLETVAGGVEASFAFTSEAGVDADASSMAMASTRDFNAGASVAISVTAAYRGTADVGEWGDAISIATRANEDDSAQFDIYVNHNDTLVETWSGLSMVSTDSNYVEEVINDEFGGSKFISVSTSGIINPDETLISGELQYSNLQNGSSGAYATRGAEVNAYASAVDLYNLEEIQLLCCPEADEAELVAKALTHCQSKGDRMFAGHTPLATESGDIKDSYSSQFQGDKVYGALYFPWVQINDPIGKRKWVPPVGHILGVYARTERERGIWKAPAGNAAKLNGVLDVRHHITDTDHTSLVKRASVNAVRFIPGKGNVIDSSRTLSTNPLWLYVNVRLLFNFVKSSLNTGLRWVVQEPHNEELWNKVKYNSVTPFLMGLWRRGAFGPGGPDEIFTVKIDSENNTPENIQQGIFTSEIYFYPSRPAETIVLIVGQQEGAGSANEG